MNGPLDAVKSRATETTVRKLANSFLQHEMGENYISMLASVQCEHAEAASRLDAAGGFGIIDDTPTREERTEEVRAALLAMINDDFPLHYSMEYLAESSPAIIAGSVDGISSPVDLDEEGYQQWRSEVVDWYREKYPDSTYDDEDIIEKFVTTTLGMSSVKAFEDMVVFWDDGQVEECFQHVMSGPSDSVIAVMNHAAERLENGRTDSSEE